MALPKKQESPAPKNAAPAASGPLGRKIDVPSDLQILLRKPAVRAFLETQLKKSNIELKSGPGGSGWSFGNEAKRAGITDLNTALKALQAIAQSS